MAVQATLRPGRTYMLHDYTLVQVVSLRKGRVRYAVRRWTWRGQPRTVVRSVRLPWLTARVRAEVDAAYFPGFGVSRPDAVEHRASETERMNGGRADRGPGRPFSAGA